MRVILKYSNKITALFLFLFFLPSLAAVGGLQGKEPLEWGQEVTGVITRFDPGEKKIIALTFDACGGGTRGSGYDGELIDLLRKERIPATLFVNARWIDANPLIFEELASDPLFEIANHGLEHKPLSVSGKEAYGIRGTTSAEEASREIEGGAEAIEKASGKRP
ncbi:MAG TPA: polysaccharide deacetylase, partial [Synergistetes bacterium]|nr:polysaccharide deacetylase [Synergistota bacterium]